MNADLIFRADTSTGDERADATIRGMASVDVAHVSASQIFQYQRCPRQWAYRQVMKLKVPPDGGLIVGSGVHAAAEVGMVAKVETGENPNADDAADIAAGYIANELDTAEVTMGEHDTPGALTDKAVRLAVAWANEAAPHVHPVEVEARFDMVVAGIPVTGRMDVVTATSVVDWKTSGKSPNRGDVVASVQTSLYALASGKPLAFWYIVNVKAVKVVPVEVSQAEADDAARLAVSTVADVAEGMALGVWPRNRMGWHCSQRFCGYYNRCLSGQDDGEFRERAAVARAAAGVTG